VKPHQRLPILWPIALVSILTCLYLAAIAGDWAPWLRGNADWRWTLLAWPPIQRLLPLLVVGVVYLALIFYWEQRLAEGRSAPRLVALVGGALLLQVATLWIRYPHPIRLIYDLAASDSINGYYTVAAGIQDIGAFLRDYPALAPTLPNHVTTHPPGLVLLFWVTGQLVNLCPSLAHTLAQAFRPLGCMHSWVQVVSDSALAGGLFAYIMPLVGALTVFPLYGLGERLYGPRMAWRTAALFPILPAFVMNVGQADQMYPFLAALAGLFFDQGLRGARGWPMLWAGIVLSLASFLSLGLLAFLLPLGLYALILWLRGVVRLDIELGWRITLLTLGLASVWLLYWCATGVNPLDIWQGGLGIHTGLERPYGRWLLFNLVDFLPSAGLALVLAIPLGLKHLLRRSGEVWLPATLLTILALDLSGLTRGEVSRLWLFLTPALTLAAAAALTAWEERRLSTPRPWGFWAVSGLLLAQLALFGARVADPHPRFYEMRTAPREIPPVQFTADARFGDAIRLVGYDLDVQQVAPGEKLELMLYWQTLARPAGVYKVFTHLYDEQTGVMAGQHDKAPLSHDWPTTCWAAGEIYQETFRIAIQPGAPPQEYVLQTGFYDEVSGERLPVQQPGFPPDTRAVLTTVKVEK
jgi:hypothetical protein